MPAYIVSLPDGVSHGNKNSDVVVFAEDATYARDAAKAGYSQGSNSAWDQATVSEIVAGSDYLGWSLRVRIEHAADLNFPCDFTVVGIASDTIDLLGAAMVTALNAHQDIAAAAYDGITNILTCAAVGDNLGDGTLTVEMRPPGQARGPFASYVGTITDGGIQAAALTVQLAADAISVAQYFGELPRRV